MGSSEIGVDKDQDGNVVLDVDEFQFRNYVSFLRGNDFILDEETVSFFDFMGHPNTM
jgi:hypothetical protein